MEFKILEDNKDKEDIELLRKEVFGLKNVGNYYLNELLNNKIYALSIIDNNIIAGCYFHRFDNILVIDQVFVKKEYQNSGLRLGRELIKELILNKVGIEYLLGGKLDICKIESQNKKSHDLYIKIGFNESKSDEDILYKRL